MLDRLGLLAGGLLGGGRLLRGRGLLCSGLGTARQFGTSRRLFLCRFGRRGRRGERGWKRRRHRIKRLLLVAGRDGKGVEGAVSRATLYSVTALDASCHV